MLPGECFLDPRMYYSNKMFDDYGETIKPACEGWFFLDMEYESRTCDL